MSIERNRCGQLRTRESTAEAAAAFIQSGMTVAMGGYTSCGYPKAVAAQLVRRRKAGEELKLFLLTASQVGPEIHEVMAAAGIIERCAPLIESRTLAAHVNGGKATYIEQQMNRMPRLLRRGAFGKVDVAIVEALGITRDGCIIPTNSVGMSPNFLEAADKIIIG